MRALLAFALVLPLIAATPASAQTAGESGGLQVAPVMLAMTPQHTLAHFRLHNGRDREASFEITAYVWTQRDGESVLTPTNAVVVAPSVFLTPPGGDQIVRLALAARPAPDGAEQSYRLVVHEIPPAPAAPGLRIVVEMSMPLFVTPAHAHGELHLERIRNLDGSQSIAFVNTGDAHLQLSVPTDAGVANAPRYLLAGQRAEREITPGVRALHLMVASAGDDGPLERSFDLSDARPLSALR